MHGLASVCVVEVVRLQLKEPERKSLISDHVVKFILGSNGVTLLVFPFEFKYRLAPDIPAWFISHSA
jgi:hypothetical protein